MGGKTIRDRVELRPKQGRREYRVAGHCLKFIFWNYHEELKVVRTESYLHIHYFVKYFTVQFWYTVLILLKM